MSVLGERLRSARERKGLSQTEVFRRTNINNKTLSRYENSGTEPDIETLKILSELYEVTIDYLAGSDESKDLEEQANNDIIIQEKMKLANDIINLPETEKKLVIDMIQALKDKRK